VPANIEIKARVPQPAALRRRAEQLSGSSGEVISQVDTFFKTSTGRLKLRRLDGRPAQLIYYDRPDDAGPKRSDYLIYETDEPEALRTVLESAWGSRGTVEKVRRLYMIGQTRVHLDEVKNLGTFVELEVVLRSGQSDEDGRHIAAELLTRLGIDQADLIGRAYLDMLEQAA
jgi:predicted adenylyl cyclase CyaB